MMPEMIPKLATGLVMGVLDILMSSRAPPEKVVLTGHTTAVYSVAWSPDGTTLASGFAETVIVWDVQTAAPLHTLAGHTDWVRSVAFSPDGTKIASGSYDGTAILWDAKTGELVRTLEGHRGWVRSVAFSPDGKRLASGSEDGTVILWRVAP